MVIIGYRMPTTDIQEIDMSLMKIQHKIQRIAEREYGKLLGEEIAFLCDNIALNVLQRRNDISIYDFAKQQLDRQIRVAGGLGTETKYNFQVYAHLIAEGEFTYIDVLCNNPVFLSAFKTLEPYGLTEDECSDSHNAKTILWKRLHKAYEKRQPLSVNLSPDIERLDVSVSYPKVGDRCQSLARHYVTNVYLNQISGGEQIPPYMLMRDMDLAMEMAISSKGAREIASKKAELAGILVDLSKDDKYVYDIPDATGLSDRKTFEEVSDE